MCDANNTLHIHVYLTQTEKIAFVFQDCKEENREVEEGGPQTTYELRQVLGTGTFAAVKLAIHRNTGMIYQYYVIMKLTSRKVRK